MQPPALPPTSELAARVRAGDAAAFEIVYSSYYESAVRTAYSVVKSVDIAKDVAHDVFLRMWDRRHTLDTNKLSKGYILASVYNRALDELKGRKVRDRYDSSLTESGKSDDSAATLARAEFESAMATLPERWVMVVRLRFQEQLEVSEIATALGISSNAAHQLLHRAVKELRRLLEPGR